MRYFTFAYAVSLGLFLLFSGVSQAETVSAGGADAWLDVPADPKASLILVPGEGGRSESDPLQRARSKFTAKGFAVLSVDKGADIGEAMKYMRETARPVYVAAVSQGVARIAEASAEENFRTRGLVLVFGNLKYFAGQLKSPKKLSRTLVVHHKDDACDKTPPKGVEKFKKWGKEKVAVFWLEGGSNGGGACGPNSNHGLAGLDDEVVAVIAKFLSKR